MDDYSESETPKSSSPLKVILWAVGIIGGLAILACCGGGFLLFRTFARGISQDPAVVRQVAAEITDIEPPESLPPAFSFQLFGMKMVSFGDPSKKGSGPMLMLMEFPASMGGNTQQMKQQMDQGLQQQGQKDQSIQIQESETKTYTIRGQEQSVVINKGTTDSGDKVVQVMATFSSKSGNPTMLMYFTPEDQWSEEEFQTIVNSMK